MKLKPIKIDINKIIFLSVLALCLVFQILNTIFINKISSRIEKQDKIKESVYVVNAPMIATDAIYRLYECGGKIGIYDANSDILLDIIDVFVMTLPENDQMALKKGIDIYTFSDLSKIIEDFSS